MTRYLLSISILFLCTSTVWSEQSPKPLYIQAIKVDLKIDAKANSASCGMVSRGDRAQIIESKGSWLKVRSGKKIGWVSRLFVASHKPVGNADLMKDVKENIVTTSRRRPSSYAVSATARGLMTSERGREGREIYESDGEALEAMEKYSLPKDSLKKFKSSGRLIVD